MLNSKIYEKLLKGKMAEIEKYFTSLYLVLLELEFFNMAFVDWR